MSKFFDRGGAWVLAQIPVLAVAALLPVWSGRSDLTFRLTERLDAVGWALTALGFLISLSGALSLGRSLTPFPRPRRDAPLHIHGIYARMRHPIYSGLIVASVGWSLLWSSPVGIGFCVLVFVFFDRKAAREERWLGERYPEYVNYTQRVRKFFPGVY